MVIKNSTLSASSDAQLVAVKLYRNLPFHPSGPQCEIKPKIYHRDINEKQGFLFWKTSQFKRENWTYHPYLREWKKNSRRGNQSSINMSELLFMKGIY